VSLRTTDSLETLETLKFGASCKSIRTRPVANVTAAVADPARQEAMIADLNLVLREREAQLEAALAKTGCLLAEQRAELESAFQHDCLTERAQQMLCAVKAQRRCSELAGENLAARERHDHELTCARELHVRNLEAQREALSQAHLEALESARESACKRHDHELTCTRDLHVRNLEAQHEALSQAHLAALEEARREEEAQRAALAGEHLGEHLAARERHDHELACARELHVRNLEAQREALSRAHMDERVRCVNAALEDERVTRAVDLMRQREAEKESEKRERYAEEATKFLDLSRVLRLLSDVLTEEPARNSHAADPAHQTLSRIHTQLDLTAACAP